MLHPQCGRGAQFSRRTPRNDQPAGVAHRIVGQLQQSLVDPSSASADGVGLSDLAPAERPRSAHW
jgi:hypothetical protein